MVHTTIAAQPQKNKKKTKTKARKKARKKKTAPPLVVTPVQHGEVNWVVERVLQHKLARAWCHAMSY